MNQSIEIANVNARFMNGEITEGMRLRLIFEIRARYENLISKK